MISAVFRKNHFLFNTITEPLKRVMMSFRKIFVQDELSLQLLQENGFANAELAGDTRFDRVWEIAQHPNDLPIIKNFKGGKKLWVAGSTWRQDEVLFIETVRQLGADWQFVIVPHEFDTLRLELLEKWFLDVGETRSSPTFYSALQQPGHISDYNVLIVDQIGLLSSIYQYADIAYVGGGFGKGIHNTLEAAVYGVPVLFGPNYEKFNEAKLLIENRGARSIKNFEELNAAFQFYQQPENIELGEANREWVKRNIGATDTIIKFLEQLNSGSASLQA